jgi:membrane protein required for colicin V production
MALLDILILIPLAYGAYKGFKNGLVKEVATLAGLVVGIYLAYSRMGDVVPFVTKWTGIDGDIASILAFLLVFGAVMFIVSGLVYGLDVLLKITLLSIPNRMMGLVFGVLKAGIGVSILLTLLAGLDVPDAELRAKSTLYARVYPMAPASYDALAFIIPGAGSFAEQVKGFIDVGVERVDPDLITP